MRLSFDRLASLPAEWAPGMPVEIEGWLYRFGPEAADDYLALVDAPPCCLGCLPREAERRIEVFAAGAIAAGPGRVRLAGTLHELTDDPAGWRFQLREARAVGAPGAPRGVFAGRRALMAAPLLCMALGTTGGCAQTTPAATDAAARDALAGIPTVDIHSHAGRVIGIQRVAERAAFTPVAGPMREGGMAVLCLATVPDAPTHQVTSDGRIRPFGDPAPGELYAYGQTSFQRIHDLAREQGLRIIADAAALAAARGDRPSIIVSAEGADFLEGQIARVAEAHARWTLRHLQLTHYRVNELGDIQTEPPVHGGLTAFGAEVIRQCNRLGIVVDVAHGTYDLVRQAAAVTTKPLVLSHTSLTNAPGPRSRQISRDHARIIAGTGGVIGIWPPTTIFADMTAFAGGIARMVDAAGIDHVALGSDMGGLVGGSAFGSYRALPTLSAALLARGFQATEVRKLLAENYLRVFTQSLA
ncbi:peptidase M19 [Roseomonas hellenica]|uniref:Peptidase M19 n=1 Tax=Plastoroseomonas hellenica TaxID=2687306 RepID=A0ABS5F0B3_9PROT|nr:membrane dipeptidase [Plastoroseomonas hellenica]MBR0665977.1 peptidase M19 [Plastoroseomonas hellenica]